MFAYVFTCLMAIHPVLLPGKSHGQRSLVGYSLWARKELDTTERLHFHFSAQRTSVGDLGLIPGSGSSLEKEMATHSSTLAWKIPWTKEPGRLQSMGSQRDMTEQLHFHFSLSCIGEGNGKIPGTGEPGGLPSMGSHRVGHD